jgi:hypothetical protein
MGPQKTAAEVIAALNATATRLEYGELVHLACVATIAEMAGQDPLIAVAQDLGVLPRPSGASGS